MEGNPNLLKDIYRKILKGEDSKCNSYRIRKHVDVASLDEQICLVTGLFCSIGGWGKMCKWEMRISNVEV